MDIDNGVTQLARRCVVLQDLISEAGRGGGSGQLGTLNRSSLNGRNSTVLWQVGVCRNDCTQRTASYRTKKKRTSHVNTCIGRQQPLQDSQDERFVAECESGGGHFPIPARMLSFGNHVVDS